MGPRVSQIAYDATLMRVRELLLAQNGYSVASACGNAEACRLLAEEAPFDVFFVAWCTTYGERKAIVHWLKERWPAVRVVAIHDSFQRSIPGADVTANHETPAEWLAAVAAATGPFGSAGDSA